MQTATDKYAIFTTAQLENAATKKVGAFEYAVEGGHLGAARIYHDEISEIRGEIARRAALVEAA